MSLLEQAAAALAGKGCTVHRCPDRAAAVARLQAIMPPGSRVALDESLPWAPDGDLPGRHLSRPRNLPPDQARAAILGAGFGVTGATAVTADTGSVYLAEELGFGRAISNMAPVHVVVAPAAVVVPGLLDGLSRARAQARAVGKPAPGYLTIISGPSRTGDIEFVLIPKVHGPGEVHVLLVEAD